MNHENGNGPDPKFAATHQTHYGTHGTDSSLFRDSAFLNWLACCYPIIVTFAYLMFGFFFNIWHPTWLLFLSIPIFYSYYGVVKKEEKRARKELVSEEGC